MDSDELLALLTLAAVAPYLAEAAMRRIGARAWGRKSGDARNRCDCR